LFRYRQNRETGIVRWWNGQVLYSIHKPKAADWFKSQLNILTTVYGVDGFKFDAEILNIMKTFIF